MTLNSSDEQRDQRGILVGRKRCTHEISPPEGINYQPQKEMKFVAPISAGHGLPGRSAHRVLFTLACGIP